MAKKQGKTKKSEIQLKELPHEEESAKKPNKFLKFLVLIVVILVLFGAIGKVVYTKIGERVAANILSKLVGTKVNVQNGGKKVTFKNNEGEFSYEEGKLPASFPKDFPAYPKAKLASSWYSKTDKGEGVSVAWETSDSVNKVAEFYKDKLAKAGWKIGNSFDGEGSSTISFEKESSSGFVGIAATSEGKTTVSVTLSLK